MSIVYSRFCFCSGRNKAGLPPAAVLGFWLLLGGLQEGYGTATALLVSAAVFALLHFNMVQTLSAAVCGLALGLLYLKTGSVLCCILAHSGYNILSYLTMLWPYLSE